jgi:hypothetical protein
MANEDHLRILRRGVEAWNQWRKENPKLIPDLINSDLTGIDLTGINLIKANLFKANLTEVKLNRATLIEAYLSWADLSWAVLSEANLSSAKLSCAKLSCGNFVWTNFTGANLSGADLVEADLTGANLSGANLQMVSLLAARLISTNLTKANLTGVYLWETQRARWSIKDVICDYVFWDEEGKEKTKYAPGEFERLFRDKVKIHLFYKNGITPLEVATVPALIRHLEEEKGCSLRFISINESAGGAIVELAIEDIDNQSAEEVKQLQETIRKEAERSIEYQKQLFVEKETRLYLEGGRQ